MSEGGPKNCGRGGSLVYCYTLKVKNTIIENEEKCTTTSQDESDYMHLIFFLKLYKIELYRFMSQGEEKFPLHLIYEVISIDTSRKGYMLPRAHCKSLLPNFFYLQKKQTYTYVSNRNMISASSHK